MLFIFGVLSFDSFSQNEFQNVRTNIVWIRYYIQIPIKKVSLHQEVDNRWFLNNGRQFQFISHTHVHYNIKNVNLGIGISYSRQSPIDPESPSKLVVPEYRPFLETTHTLRISKKLELANRMRYDFRFVQATANDELLDNYIFNPRIRLRPQLTYTIGTQSSTNYTKLKIADEIMFHNRTKITRTAFDQNRIYVALEQSLFKKTSAEIGYMHLYQSTKNANIHNIREIIRLSIYSKL
ncbi:MAG: DUF2490 domain-containing protein [Leadbetterella sp.]